MSEPLTPVAVDIETTGFGADDEVTVIGFALPMGCRVCCQTGGRPLDSDIEAAVADRVEDPVTLTTHQTETALLRAVDEFVTDRLADDDVVLVAYHGETWNGGFDLPFLRTRYAAHELPWPFAGLPYADLLPIFDDLFNTTMDGTTASDLVSVYDLLGDGPCGTVDPFDDSGEAVTAFEAGRIDDVVVHNVADITRTAALARLAERYCSKSDFKLKSLTPTVAGDR